ncbi:MAG: cyclic nucleotide-binding domain-containing protein [Treponema sp.]|nr:cyclic nucleotide-binding domain-containing protein [Treponema sp.]
MPKIVPYSKGSVIFFEGDKADKIFILQSGSVTLTTTDIVTHESIKEQLSVGQFFGLKSVLARKTRIETATAMSDSQVVMLTLPEFEKNFSNNKAIISKMFGVFTKALIEWQGKTERFLKSGNLDLSREEKMELVAKSLLEDERYFSAQNQCEKIFRDIKEPCNKESVEGLLAQAKEKLSQQETIGASFWGSDKPPIADFSAALLKQFSLPIFERFKKSFSDGEVIISEFTKVKSFYFILEGEISVEKYINGKMKLYGMIGPGEFFGELELIEEMSRSASCIARGNVTCLKFGKDNFKSVVAENGTAAMSVLKTLSSKIYSQRRALKILCIKELSVRVADVFLMYDEDGLSINSDPDSESLERKFYITVSDMAEWASITVDEARDELNKFASKNKVAIYADYMVVSNIMDMKRTVDSYYSNLDDEKKK